MFIRSERLFLRPSWPEDWEELFGLLSDDAVALNIGAERWPRTVDEAKAFVCRPRENLLPQFFIYLREDEDSRLIGGIGLGRNGDQVELGYWIAPAWWGQGFATEALAAMLEHAQMLGHRRLIAVHFADNRATARVLEKAGFVATGETGSRRSISRGVDVPTATYAADLETMDVFSRTSIGHPVAPSAPA